MSFCNFIEIAHALKFKLMNKALGIVTYKKNRVCAEIEMILGKSSGEKRKGETTHQIVALRILQKFK